MSLTKFVSFLFLVIINELERDLGGNRHFIRNFIWAAPPPTIVPRESPRQNHRVNWDTFGASEILEDVFLERKHSFMWLYVEHNVGHLCDDLTVEKSLNHSLIVVNENQRSQIFADRVCLVSCSRKAILSKIFSFEDFPEKLKRSTNALI